MNAKPAELAQEQAYFDAAAAHRERKLATLAEVQQAAAHPGAAGPLQRYGQAAREAIVAAGAAVAFGRIDTDTGDRLYIGRQLIRDRDFEVMVVNWQAPAAAAYFEASPADPGGVARKRTFDCQGNTIRDFTDLLFGKAGPTAGLDPAGTFAPAAEVGPATEAGEPAGPPSADPFLLAALTRGRTGSMREIVATIQAAQYDLIRTPIDRVLVIEGGPGTGKTSVALHRLSWLLYHHRDRLRPADLLVVGPHPTFVSYISQVLPELGEDGVVLRDLTQLAPPVTAGRPEPAPVSAIKGDPRLAGLLHRALTARIGAPEPAERIMTGSGFLTLPGGEITAQLDQVRALTFPYAHRRQLLRERLGQLVRERGARDTDVREPLANLLERLWPQVSAPAFLRDLLGSRRRLAAAGAGEFTDDELALLYRRGADRISAEVWSAADLPLLDELTYLIDGGADRYAYVLVDEAQDLSPMQLRSVARRCATGAMTVVGDLAQSTGPWARDSWQEVTRHLPGDLPVSVAPLRYGYRVPRQVYEQAATLLPVAAPHTQPPEVVRDGPAAPQIHQVGLAERAGRAVAVAAWHAEAGRFVGIICPPRCRRELTAALTNAELEWSSAGSGTLGAAVNVVSPQEAKGLEFDAVVVIEPEQIVADDPRGHRLLYVALTRTTTYLDIVCVGEPIPLAMPAGAGAGGPEPAEEAPFGQREIARLAEHLAGRLRAAAPPAVWPQVLDELARQLDPPG